MLPSRLSETFLNSRYGTERSGFTGSGYTVPQDRLAPPQRRTFQHEAYNPRAETAGTREAWYPEEELEELRHRQQRHDVRGPYTLERQSVVPRIHMQTSTRSTQSYPTMFDDQSQSAFDRGVGAQLHHPGTRHEGYSGEADHLPEECVIALFISSLLNCVAIAVVVSPVCFACVFPCTPLAQRSLVYQRCFLAIFLQQTLTAM